MTEDRRYPAWRRGPRSGRHLAFLRQHGEFSFGVPKEDRLRTLMDRIDPALFEAAFMAWVADLRPDGPEVVALDGKTLRRDQDTNAAHMFG